MRYISAILMGLVVGGCTSTGGSSEVPLESVPTTAVAAPPKIRNVILMIGDGMGPQQVGLLELYAARVPNSPYPAPTALHRFMDAGYVGISRHDPAEAIVVDSACSASQLATGKPSLSEAIGLDVTGNTAETVLEIAMKTGRAAGLVSDTRLTHATPAAFAAHVPHRDLENEIAAQMIAVGPEVMLSGGLRHFLPQGVKDKESAAYQQAAARLGASGVKIKSKRTDDEDLLARAEAAGYALAFDRAGLAAASPDKKLLGLFSDSGMMDGIAHHLAGSGTERKEPSLRELTEAAIQRLSRDEDGFFLMVEGGQIDWAAHSNDAGTMLHEMIKFDQAIDYVYSWASQRNDTLVIITADHETGGFGLSYAHDDNPPSREIPGGMFVGEHPYRPDYDFGAVSDLERLYAQKKALYPLMLEFNARPKAQRTPAALAEAVNAISEFDITAADAKGVLDRGATELTWSSNEDYYTNLIGAAMSREQNVVWATGTHTHTPVPVVAWGPDAVSRPFSHMLHHTEIGQLLIAALR